MSFTCPADSPTPPPRPDFAPLHCHPALGYMWHASQKGHPWRPTPSVYGHLYMTGPCLPAHVIHMPRRFAHLAVMVTLSAVAPPPCSWVCVEDLGPKSGPAGEVFRGARGQEGAPGGESGFDGRAWTWRVGDGAAHSPGGRGARSRTFCRGAPARDDDGPGISRFFTDANV